MRKQKQTYKESGITLIALVITIIILLILAGISIRLLTGEDGLIAKALQAKEKNSLEQEKELLVLAINSTKMRLMTEENPVEEDVFLEELEQNFGQGGVKLDPQGNSIYNVTVKESGRIYNVDISTGRIDVANNSEAETYPKREDYEDVPETDASYFVFDPATGSITSLANIKGYYAQEMTYPAVLKIPEEIDGVTVTSVVLSAGAMISDVTDVVIPDTVTVLGEEAFHNMINLKNVVMPSGLKEIKRSAFSSCKSIENLEIPNTVNFLDELVFNNTDSLKELTITSDDIEINQYCFQSAGMRRINITGNNIQDNSEGVSDYVVVKNCKNLEEINMGRGSITIKSCYKLKNINVKEVKGIDLTQCEALETVKVENLNGGLNIENCGLLTNLIIEENTSNASIYIENCARLKELNIPNTISLMGTYLPEIEKITIPADYNKLNADSLYYKMPALKEIVVPEGGNYVFEDGVLYNKDKTEVVWVPLTNNQDVTKTISEERCTYT